MKVLILYTYNKGYLSSFFFELSKKLHDDGFSVVNYALKHRAQSFTKDGVQITIEKKSGYLSNYYKIFKIIKKHQPDVVLSNFSYVNPALLFGKILGVKKNMSWFHSLNNQMSPTRANVFIKTQFLRLADTIIANSYFTQEELHHIYKVNKSKISTVPFWTNISEEQVEPGMTKFATHQGVLHMGCPGRLTAHKNQQLVLKVAQHLKTSGHNDFRLYFAGRGEMQVPLNELTKSYGLQDHVNFLEHLSAEDMVHFYNEMDVVVLPSLDEAFGLVFIEAIALGVPVVVSKRFGALSFIDQERFDMSKFTFDPNSAEDLERTLIPFFNKTNLTSKFYKELYETIFCKDDIYNLIKNQLTP